MKAFYWILFAASLIAILAAVGYSWQNISGHTGASPLAFSQLFAPVFAIGIIGLLVRRGQWLPARAVVSISLVGLAFGLFVTKLGILNEYGDWITAGMADRNPRAPPWLMAYVLCGIGVSLAGAFLVNPKRQIGK